MDPCRIFGGATSPTDKTVLCSGSCAKFFHPSCVGLNSTNHKAWTANVGLLWFCDICRVNFNPVVVDRETVLLKTLRDLLVHVDSMDLRIGQYGENLKILNTMLSAAPPNRRESNVSNRLQQLLSDRSTGNVLANFHSSIDRMNLDNSLQSQLGNYTADEEGLGVSSPISPSMIGTAGVAINPTGSSTATSSVSAATSTSTTATTAANPTISYTSVTAAFSIPATTSSSTTATTVANPTTSCAAVAATSSVPAAIPSSTTTCPLLLLVKLTFRNSGSSRPNNVQEQAGHRLRIVNRN